MQYKLAAKERQKRLDAIKAGQTRSLSNELAVIRLMIQESLDAGSPAAAHLIEIARRLALDDATRAIRERDLMDRDTVLRLAREIGDALHDTLEHLVPDITLRCLILDDWEARCAALTAPRLEGPHE